MITALNDVISNKAIVQIHKKTIVGLSFLDLHEYGEDSDISELRVDDIPDDSFAFTLDVPQSSCNRKEKIEYFRLSHYLKSSNNMGLCKSCDLIIVTRKENRYSVILLEQKSKDPIIDDANRQLENSKVFFIYLINMISSIYNIDIDLRDVEFKKVMATTRISRGTVKITSPKNERELERRSKLSSLGMKEISIRSNGQRKGFLRYESLLR